MLCQSEIRSLINLNAMLKIHAWVLLLIRAKQEIEKGGGKKLQTERKPPAPKTQTVQELITSHLSALALLKTRVTVHSRARVRKTIALILV